MSQRPAVPPPPLLMPPDGVATITAQLERSGFDAWCVGGVVRDAVMGHPGHDWDLASRATPAEIMRRFPRTVPTGLDHGTVTILDSQGEPHEHTTFRADMATDGRHATIAFAKTIEEDLARRDFTINAMAYRPATGTLADPFDGQADARARMIRAVGDPHVRMAEDRLRALRALRFAGRFDATIDPATWEAICASVPHLDRLSTERVKMELDKTFTSVARPGATLQRWQAAGALGALVPALGRVTPLTFAAMDAARAHAPDRDTAHLDAWTGLCWEVGAEGARQVMRQTKATTHEAQHVQRVLAGWERIGPAVRPLLELGEVPEARQLRRWAADVGRETMEPILRLTAARWTAERTMGQPAPGRAPVEAWAVAWRETAASTPLSIKELGINGNDLRRVGVKPGPGMGQALALLLDAVVDDPARNEPQWLLQHAAQIAGQADEPRPQPSAPLVQPPRVAG